MPRLRATAAALFLALAAALPPGPPPASASPLAPVPAAPAAATAYLPAGFRNELLIGGLFEPTVVQFAADGRVFVAQKNGKVLVFDSLSDTTPTVFANLEANVHNWWDRGMLGMVLDPNFTSGQPYVYVLYAYNHPLGAANPAPRWPSGDPYDSCPTPPGSNTDGCVISGRLSRLTADGNAMTGPEHVLVEDWCQQFGSHSVGNLAFGPEGALYATGGDGAYFFGIDYGQKGGTLPDTTDPVTPRNPCGDPPGGVGGTMAPPTAQGGALRSQDLQTPADPTGLNGTLIRIDPHSDTGTAWSTNNLIGSLDLNARRIVAYGLRNPFRFAVQPGGRVWIGDVGYNSWEEIDELPSPSAPPRNFGWPCYEGSGALPDYMDAGLTLCTGLDPGEVTSPFFTYHHNNNVVAGDPCGTGSSAIAGLTFLGTKSSYPDSFDNALFFADYNRRCIWYMPADTAGRPIAAQRALFADLRLPGDAYGGAVYLTTSPDGDLVYVDFAHGEIRRIRYYGVNVPPTAAFIATRGPSAFEYEFDASGTTDPNPSDPLKFAWDLDGDGAFDDGAGVTESRTYSVTEPVDVGLLVTDGALGTDTVTHRVYPGDLPPQVTMVTPAASLHWSVGEQINVSATATDLEDGTLPASAFQWTLSMEHCPSNCHTHTGLWSLSAKSGSFPAPDHDYPSHLKLTVTVTDSVGQTASVSRDLYPATATTSVASSPTGIPLTLGSRTGSPPPPVTTIAGSHVSVSAPATYALGETNWAFKSWSDGGAAVHDAATPAGSRTLTATYQVQSTRDASNTCAGAPTGLAPDGLWTAGQFGSSSDVDWYRFSLPSTTRVRLVLGDLAVDGRLELYHGCSTLVATSDRRATMVEELIVSLGAGSYAIRLSGSGSPSTPPYSRLIRAMPATAHVMAARSRVSGSTLTLVGEVYNNTTSTRGPINVTARLYDATGTLLATRSVSPALPALLAGTRTPFRIVGPAPVGFHHASYTVSAPVSSARVVRPTVTGVSVGPDSSNKWKVSGTVRNGSSAIRWLRVDVAAYDNRGEIVDTIRAVVGATSLAANGSTTFSATFPTVGYVPIRTVVWTYALR